MKFLVIERHRESLTREVLKNVAPAMFDYLGKLGKLGKVQHWVLAGQAGGVMLLDVDSNEELAVILSGSPIYPYTTREIYPLWEPAKAKGMLDQLIGQMDALAGES
jgi:muconolactone delta-isomerase